MVAPFIESRVEQPDHLSRVRIRGLLAVSLMAVTEWTGEKEVRFIIGSTMRLGHDVLDLEERADDAFGRVAISTTE